MKTKSFQLKEILPNPFRRMEKYPLLEAKVGALCESIEATEFWENIVVRVNDAGRPELAYGHHRLAALRKLYPSTKDFDWIIRPLTDGVMIQMMARENGESYKTNAAVLRETITAAVEALGAGKIAAEEMPIVPRTDPRFIRFAPSFVTVPAGGTVLQTDENKEKHPYTIEALAKFLGMVKGDGKATNSFSDSFGALELISEGYLTEKKIEGLEVRKLGEVVAAIKKQRDAAIKDAERLSREAEARRQEAIRKAAELKKQQEEAETKRKAAAEAERIAAIKRAEEKAKRDAEEAIRRAAADKIKRAEAEQRAIAEAKRKEEEERQRKIRDAQRAEAERQRAEAERARQAAFAKAKKEEDERKAEQMRKDAEAAKARAEADAKRKEEAARHAEIAAEKRTEEERERQALAAKKRAEEEEERAKRHKEQWEKARQKEREMAYNAQVRAETAKKKAEEDERKKKEEIATAEAEAKRKDAEAKKEAAEAKAQVRAGADRLAEEAKTINRDNIRNRGQEIAEDVAAKSGRKVAARSSPVSHVIDDDTIKMFHDAINNAKKSGTTLSSRISVPVDILKTANDIISAGMRALALKRHPDHGGSQEEMQLLNAATAWLRQLIEKEKK